MSYAFKYWRILTSTTIRQTNPVQIIFPVLAGIIAVNGFRRFDTVRILIGAVLGLGVFALLLLILTLSFVVRNAGLYAVLDKNGFGIEYLREYEKRRITGKPFNLQYAVEYAEIFMNMGQPAEAIKYLNTITVPSTSNGFSQVAYFYVYVMCALKINNLAIAEDMWSRSSQMIESVRTKPNYSTNSYMLYLAMISTDCFAARQNGDVSRLQRAYEQTVAYMNSADYKKYPVEGCDFDILLLYELKALGRNDEFNALYPTVKAKIEKFKPMFDSMKERVTEEFNKAVNGILPI